MMGFPGLRRGSLILQSSGACKRFADTLRVVGDDGEIGAGGAGRVRSGPVPGRAMCRAECDGRGEPGRLSYASPSGMPARSARRAWNSEPQHPPNRQKCGNRRRIAPSCSPSATGSPSSSDVDLFNSAWLFGDGLARTPPMRRSQSPPTSRAGAICVGWAQLTIYEAGAPPVAASTACTASRTIEPSGSLPSVSTVKETTQGMPARGGSGDPDRLARVRHGLRRYHIRPRRRVGLKLRQVVGFRRIAIHRFGRRIAVAARSDRAVDHNPDTVLLPCAANFAQQGHRVSDHAGKLGDLIADFGRPVRAGAKGRGIEDAAGAGTLRRRRIGIVIAPQRRAALLIVEQRKGGEVRQIDPVVEDQRRLQPAVGHQQLAIERKRGSTILNHPFSPLNGGLATCTRSPRCFSHPGRHTIVLNLHSPDCRIFEPTFPGFPAITRPGSPDRTFSTTEIRRTARTTALEPVICGSRTARTKLSPLRFARMRYPGRFGSGTG